MRGCDRRGPEGLKTRLFGNSNKSVGEVLVFSERIIDLGGDAKIPSFRLADAQEGDFDAELVIKMALLRIDFT